MCGMQIVDQDTHRVLAYIDALNRHGVRPSRPVVNEFADNPHQKHRNEGGVFSGGTGRALLAAMLEGRSIPQETFCGYLARLSWINEENDAVELTAVGRALLKSLNAPAIEESAADVFEVVLSPDNPFAYAQALGGLASVKKALLIEPYFRLDQLMDVFEFENVERVLVGDRLKKHEYELLATGLASLPGELKIEIRKATDLHDRYLIPAEDGQVVMLGASLGGIGKKVSTMTTLGALASVALRDAHEKIWKTAETIEPKQPVKAVAAPITPSGTTSGPASKKTAATGSGTKKAASRRAD